MKAERLATTRSTKPQSQPSSYFSSREIKRLGISPYSELGTLSGITLARRKNRARTYYHKDTSFTKVDKSKTGLVIAKPSLKKTAVNAGLIFTAFTATTVKRAQKVVTTLSQNVNPIYTLPVAGFAVSAVLTLGVLNAFFGSVDTSQTPDNTLQKSGVVSHSENRDSNQTLDNKTAQVGLMDQNNFSRSYSEWAVSPKSSNTAATSSPSSSSAPSQTSMPAQQNPTPVAPAPVIDDPTLQPITVPDITTPLETTDPITPPENTSLLAPNSLTNLLD